MIWAEIPDDAKLILCLAWWSLVIAASAWRAVQARRARRWVKRPEPVGWRDPTDFSES